MANNNTTTVNAYDYKPSKEQPQAFQCGGTANAGKVLTVDTDGYIRPKTAGGGATYTGTNGITVDNTNYTIGIDSSSSTETEMKKLKVSDTMTLDKGATFTAGTGATLIVNCDSEFNSDTLFTETVDMSNAKLQLPSIAVTGTSGTLTSAQGTTLTDSKVAYIEKDNNKYYYCGYTLDSSLTTLIRTITFVCPQEGKIVCTCTGTGTYTYTGAFTSCHLYQHSLILEYTSVSTSSNKYYIVTSIFTTDNTALTTSTVVAALTNYYSNAGDSIGVIGGGYVQEGSSDYGILLVQASGGAAPTSQNVGTITYSGPTYGGLSITNISFDSSAYITLTSVTDSVVQIR